MSGITPIEDVEQFIELFQKWHSLRVHGLEKIVQADEGTVIQIGENPLTLQGDALLAFRTGVQFCLELFRESPLVEIHNSRLQGNYVH